MKVSDSATVAPVDSLEPAIAERWSGRAHSIFGIGCILSILAVRFMGGLPIAVAFDPNKEHCLTGFHLGVFVRYTPKAIHVDDLVVFKPVPALAYVREPYVMKQVAAVAGDHLVIQGDVVCVNGKPVVHGLVLAGLYHVLPKALERDEIVPKGKLFVVGDAARSDDSRYWGYLSTDKVVGETTRLF